MARIKRSTVFAYLVIVSTTVAALVAGCAESDDVELDPGGTTPGIDGGKDARTADGRSAVDDDEDSGSDETKDSGQDTGSDEDGDDAGSKDAGSDASDSGSDAGDAGKDAGPDGGDAGSDAGDAGVDAGNDAGDSGTGSAVKPAQGEVVISEVMYNPSTAEPDSEWIEIYNAAAGPRRLSGLVLKDGGNRSHTIGAGVDVAAGAYVVLAAKRTAAVAAKVPDAAILYEYGTTLALANGTNGAISLFDGATEIARARYGTEADVGSGGFGLTNAKDQTIQLKVLTYAGAAVKTNWCLAVTAWTANSDKGTPGAPHDCP
jgi:Lamin Tail Domain